MPPKYNEHLMMRIATEAQLLAEEKWIIGTLTKIKKQRNCLQIEKLHLENLRSQMKMTPDQKTRVECRPTSPSTSQSSALDMMQNPSGSQIVHEVPLVEMNDEICNFEELNLEVTNSVFNNTESGAFDTEEEEEEGIENCLIDMNMFMYNGPSRPPASDDNTNMEK